MHPSYLASVVYGTCTTTLRQTVCSGILPGVSDLPGSWPDKEATSTGCWPNPFISFAYHRIQRIARMSPSDSRYACHNHWKPFHGKQDHQWLWGTPVNVLYKLEPEGHEAVCAYIEVKNSLIAIKDLLNGVVPIFPKSVQFTHCISKSRSIHISHTQLPLVSAWAFTDYKVQGSSMDAVIVDLASACGIQNGYVMLSQATGLQNLAVFCWFSPHRIFTHLQEELRKELDCITWLDCKTLEWFNTCGA